jgi:cell division transport system permease protein
MFGRILSNTRKHILRSGWVGWASVFVMTLAFLVASIFAGLALIANLYIQYIESKSNMLVFFEVGMDPNIISRLETKWGQDDRISEIIFLSEEDAFDFYAAYTSRVVPEQYQVLTRFEEKKLPSSLEIKIKSLGDITEVQTMLQADINEEVDKLIILNVNEEDSEDVEDTQSTDEENSDESPVVSPDGSSEVEDSADSDQDSSITPSTSPDDIRYRYSDEVNEPPINLIVDNENLETLKDVFFKVRIAGIAALSLLFIFVSIFIFMTVEFRLYNQKDEIGVMQLVGGSLFFIRAPYVIEGGFYGLVGAWISSAVIGGLVTLVFVVNKDSSLTQYLYDNFAKLPWPDMTALGWVAIVLVLGAIGFVLGSVSSYLSIRRYIR